MSLLLGLLAANAIVHGIVVARFGVGNNNQPFLVFALVYAALAVAVYLSVPHALWAVLTLSVIGIVGLSVTFNKPVRDKTLDKVIWVLDAATILCVGYLPEGFLRQRGFVGTWHAGAHTRAQRDVRTLDLPRNSSCETR